MWVICGSCGPRGSCGSCGSYGSYVGHVGHVDHMWVMWATWATCGSCGSCSQAHGATLTATRLQPCGSILVENPDCGPTPYALPVLHTPVSPPSPLLQGQLTPQLAPPLPAGPAPPPVRPPPTCRASSRVGTRRSMRGPEGTLEASCPRACALMEQREGACV